MRHIGLSEVGADTIRRAAAVHPIADLQIEYSLLSRGIEDEILATTRELGIGVTAYGVLSRGLLSGHWSPEREIGERRLPRRAARASRARTWSSNLALVDGAARAWRTQRGATVAQVAIAWALSRGDDIVPLVGARRRERLHEALGALDAGAGRRRPGARSSSWCPPAPRPASATPRRRWAAGQRALTIPQGGMLRWAAWKRTPTTTTRCPRSGSALTGVAISATLHCLTGCAIGEVAGMAIGTALGFSDWGTVALAVALAFLFGYSLTSLPLLRAGLALSVVVPIALASDTLSIATMEIVDNAVMLAIPGAMHAGLDDVLFWGSLSFALAVAGVVGGAGQPVAARPREGPRRRCTRPASTAARRRGSSA